MNISISYLPDSFQKLPQYLVRYGCNISSNVEQLADLISPDQRLAIVFHRSISESCRRIEQCVDRFNQLLVVTEVGDEDHSFDHFLELQFTVMGKFPNYRVQCVPIAISNPVEEIGELIRGVSVSSQQLDQSIRGGPIQLLSHYSNWGEAMKVLSGDEQQKLEPHECFVLQEEFHTLSGIARASKTDLVEASLDCTTAAKIVSFWENQM
ncbi:hypothetical protein BJ742DRAFT_808270 [Cladochytrium replicatum]|nr:hypothetical protein BJ742DRAFT_808270 [Cladochytrium replicatum]